MEAPGKVFSVLKDHTPKDKLTISTRSCIGATGEVSYFSLGGGTSIAPESYADHVLYVAAGGEGMFGLGTGTEAPSSKLYAGDALIIAPNTLCGVYTREGFVYTEIITGRELAMNEAVKPGEVLRLADLVPYQEGSIVNLDVAHNDQMKFAVMAFDAGTGLSPHRAPGDALLFALEGRATIGYEGKDHEIEAGQNFCFAKGGLHSVNAGERFKMALLITLA